MDDDTEKTLTRYLALNGITFKTDVPQWLREQLIKGYRVELEHGSKIDPRLNISRDAIPVTIKIALAHLMEAPDYYTRLEEMERQADAHWNTHRPEFMRMKVDLDSLLNSIKY